MRELDWEKIATWIRLWQVIVAVMAGVIVAGVVWAIGDKLPPQIPLFYSRPWGEEQLSPPLGMVWPIGVVASAVGLSWVVDKLKVDKILAAFVAGAGLVAEVIVVMGIIRIILIIT